MHTLFVIFMGGHFLSSYEKMMQKNMEFQFMLWQTDSYFILQYF